MARVVITHPLHQDGMNELAAAGLDTVVAGGGAPEQYLPLLQDADALIIRIGYIDRETMEKCPRLKVIGRPGVGVDNIDVAAATALGIPVVTAPGGNTRSVAECAFAMMLSAIKDLPRADRELRQGRWQVRSEYRARELYGKTLGLIGCGHIGSLLAAMGAAFGMQVQVYDPYVRPESITARGWTCSSDLHSLLRTADVVSLHVPLTAQTRHMISAAELACMKSTAVLVNCARGEVINEADLCAALQRRQIQAACLDVWACEPVPAEHPLLQLDNVIALPHMAGLTAEAASNVATAAARGVAAVLRGEQWPDVCNPECYQKPLRQ